MRPSLSDRTERVAAAGVLIGALALTALFAVPVLQQPSDRLVGREIVGRHPDAYNYIEQFAAGPSWYDFTQPATDWPAALVGTLAGGVVAYNAVVLATFPLAALAMFLLCRRLGCRRGPAAFVSLLFAFSPFHIAHTAYHPHIAQIHWLPLMLLALVAVLEVGGRRRLGLFLASSVLLVAANFYASLQLLIAVPVVAITFWAATPAPRRPAVRRRAIALFAALLGLVAAAGLLLLVRFPHILPLWRSLGEFPESDLDRYSARWWSYLVPPEGHPLFGGWVERFWSGHPLAPGRVEHQLYVGIAPLLLASVAVVVVARRVGTSRRRSIYGLAALAVAAFCFSLSPRFELAGLEIVRPSQLFYLAVPMFRSYARNGLLVVLAVLLLAGLALGYLLARGRKARAAAVVLAAIAVLELTPLPPFRWHWVLPTAAHRWLAARSGELTIVDCVKPTLGQQSITDLMPHPTSVLGVFSRRPPEARRRRFWTDLELLDPVRPISDCAEPGLAGKLAALGYTHLLLRADYRLADRLPEQGLVLENRFEDSAVYRIEAAPAEVYTREIDGFYWRDGPAGSTHRWMGPAGVWQVINTSAAPRAATLSIEILSVERPRELIVLLAEQPFERLEVTTEWRRFILPDLPLEPGVNRLTFVPTGRPTVPADSDDSRDERPLTVAVGDWRWVLEGP